MININNILPKDNELTDFEKMIMKWTAFDHYCPSIKAEVIWDMMLSEFIVDMVAYAYRENDKDNKKKYTVDDFYLLAKEFPIETNKDSLRAAKADYLVASKKDNKIIIVELKSTPGSFSPGQLMRYRDCIPEKMFDFYNALISQEVGPSLYNKKEPLEWADSQKYAGQITYMYQQYRTATNEEEVSVSKKPTDDDRRSYLKRFHSVFISKLKEQYVNLDVIYLYVVLEEPDTTNCSNGNVKPTRELSINMNVEKVYRSPKGNEQDNKQDNSSCTIYPNNEFMNFLSNNKEGINKKKAWETFCKLINAVNHYKNDFEEMKKIYEPNNRA